MNERTVGSLEPDLLSVKSLARVVDCSPKTVRDWLYKDRKRPSADPLPYYRLQGLIRFRMREVMAWVERRRVRIASIELYRSE